ncbi:MAG: hypothetical protein ACP5I8_05115, partial [Phycisphaerae bacterium]
MSALKAKLKRVCDLFYNAVSSPAFSSEESLSLIKEHGSIWTTGNEQRSTFFANFKVSKMLKFAGQGAQVE